MAAWYYARNGRQSGPADIATLLTLARSGGLTADDLVWSEGMAAWVPAGQIADLASAFAAVPAASAAAGRAVPTPAAGHPGATPLPYRGYATPSAPGGDAGASGTPGQHAALALTAMILGLVSFVIGGPCVGAAALICGWIALNGMKRTGNYENKGFAITGVVIGGLWTGLAILALLVVIGFLIAAAVHG